MSLLLAAPEQDQDLSPNGIARRRKELGQQAVTELAKIEPLQIAERAVMENIDYLERKWLICRNHAPTWPTWR